MGDTDLLVASPKEAVGRRRARLYARARRHRLAPMANADPLPQALAESAPVAAADAPSAAAPVTLM